MPTKKVHQCQCLSCQQEEEHSLQEYHRHLNLFVSHLSPSQRRMYAAIEANHRGVKGKDEVAKILGIGKDTIGRGCRELITPFSPSPPEKFKAPNGRPKVEDKDPSILKVMEELLNDETAGDPMKEHKWVRSSSQQLSKRLKERGYSVSHSTVWRLLKRMGFSMRTNVKKRRGYAGDVEKRDAQFLYLASKKEEFRSAGLPFISVDAKKKELIGDFKCSGRIWCREAEEVNKYDFPSLAQCRATPYGIYDILHNQGFVYVGTSGNTPEFSVDVIARWWREEGKSTYSTAKQLLILADGGGSNGWRSRAWKQQIQSKLCDAVGLTVTVCHFPTRCSHWNPIERMLFTQISINWAGKPLRTLQTMLGYIRGTTTKTGLSVKAYLQDGIYKKGLSVSKREMDALSIQHHEICPDWNYTISPRQIAVSSVEMPDAD